MKVLNFLGFRACCRVGRKNSPTRLGCLPNGGLLRGCFLSLGALTLLSAKNASGARSSRAVLRFPNNLNLLSDLSVIPSSESTIGFDAELQSPNAHVFFTNRVEKALSSSQISNRIACLIQNEVKMSPLCKVHATPSPKTLELNAWLRLKEYDHPLMQVLTLPFRQAFNPIGLLAKGHVMLAKTITKNISLLRCTLIAGSPQRSNSSKFSFAGKLV